MTDIAAAHAAIVARGARNERPPQLEATMPDHELWIGFLRDPDGNLIGLMEEKRQSSLGEFADQVTPFAAAPPAACCEGAS